MEKRTKYPQIETYNQGTLKVSGGHEIYFEECGNPKGKPVLFVHGGPGAGCDEGHRSYFNPDHYRIVLFDQRGCGRSKPFAKLEDNTTWDLVSDMELIREKLGIEKWQVFGGSWGSTLSLTYAITHPERVTELIVRGIFLCRDQDLEWFYQKGADAIFPDAWESYVAPIPKEERGDFLQAFHKRLTGSNKAEQLAAAKAWSQWEGSTILLFPNEDTKMAWGSDDFAIALSRIENHYFVNRAFFKSSNWILENISKIREHKIPGVIVHGRYDMCTPLYQAWELSKAWPEARLEIVADSGHAASEGGIVDALIRATDSFT